LTSNKYRRGRVQGGKNYREGETQRREFGEKREAEMPGCSTGDGALGRKRIKGGARKSFWVRRGLAAAIDY